MTITLEAVEAAALQLSPAERAELIERLVDTVSPAPPLHPAWQAEVARRVAEMDEGVGQSIPADTVSAEVRSLIEVRRHKA